MPVTSGFEILVAIDLRGGRVVRLEQGDFDRETAFANDPLVVATAFVDAGARWLHVVDLDGARSGMPTHAETITAIVGTVGDRASVEVAGGLRTEEGVAAVLATGAARAVVGTAALADPAFAGRLVATHGAGRIAVAVDVRDDRAVGYGWNPEMQGVNAADAIARLEEAGVETFEVTAIDRDGLLAGPDLALYERIVGMDRGTVIASGGIASTDDLRALRDAGCSGAIVGRALYTGRLGLAEVLAFADGSA